MGYLRRVGKHWVAFVVGEVPALVVFGLQLKGVNVPHWLYVALVPLGIIVAQYRAYRERDKEAKTLEGVRDHLARNRAIRDDLGKLIRDGDRVLQVLRSTVQKIGQAKVADLVAVVSSQTVPPKPHQPQPLGEWYIETPSWRSKILATFRDAPELGQGRFDALVSNIDLPRQPSAWRRPRLSEEDRAAQHEAFVKQVQARLAALMERFDG